MMLRAVLSLFLVLALAGCGGGSVTIVWDHGFFAVVGGSSRVTISANLELNGSAFLPHGARCSFSSAPSAAQACSCEPGPQVAGQWLNSATGAAGPLELAISAGPSCVPLETLWRSGAIPLAAGHNFITLTLSDAVTQGSASVTVLRN